jgi:uracil-DNA glycosylase family 4
MNLDWQKYSTKQVPGQYVANAPVLLLGWYPGKEENNRGIPFCGQSGDELNTIYLPSAGLQRYNCNLDFIIQYHSWSMKKASINDINIAKPEFFDRLKRINSKYIIAFSDANCMFHSAGNKFKISSNRGIPYAWNDKIILPTFHPAAGLKADKKDRQYPRTMSFILEDFKYFGRIISDEEPFIPMQPNAIKTIHINKPGQITKLLQDVQIIAVDTEFNPETGDLWSLQFSTNAETGYLVLTADTDLIREFAEIVNSRKIEIIYHNALADLPKLEKIGIQTHKIQDTMQMAYVLGTQLKGLKPLTARLLHIRLSEYETVINSAQQCKVAEHLDHILEQEIPEIPLEIEYSVDGTGKPKKVTEFKKWWKSLCLKTFGDENQLKIETQKFNDKFLLAFNADDEFKSAVKQAEVDRNLEIFKLENSGKKIGKKIETAHSKFNKLVIKFAKQRDAKKKYTPEKFQSDVQRVTKKFSPKGTNLIKSWKNYGHCSQLENLFGKPELATLADVNFTKALKYAGSDPACTFGIWEKLTDLIKQEDQNMRSRMQFNGETRQYEYLYRPCLLNALQVDYNSMPLICDVINTGFRIDVDYFHRKSAECKVIIDQAREEIFFQVGHKFNINSNQQLLKVLNDLGIKVETTNAMVLKEIEHPFLELLSKYKKAIKLHSTYWEPMPKLIKSDGRLHSEYSISRASTSRFNSFNMNAQNIPREVRTGIIPAPDCSLFAIDYSGQELRILAHFSQDAEMLETFRLGKNPHKEVAAELFGVKPSEVTDIQKSVAKGVNFGIPYGTSAFGLAATLQGKGIKEIDGRPMDETLAQEYIDKYFRKYPGIKAWIEKVKKEVSEYGYSETYSGHRRMIPEAFSSIWKIKSAAGRYGVNNWIQGTGGDMLKLCCPGLKAFYTQFNQIDKILRPIILVHDEIVWEISDHIVVKNLPVVVWFMENSIKLDLQVKTEVKYSQKNWQDCMETPLAKVIEFYEKLA